MGFYENLADNYDDMTRFDDRLKREKLVFEAWIARYKFNSVLDVACGTGLHSILLSQLGLEVTGVDLSEAMLEKARNKSKEKELNIEWKKGAMNQLVLIIEKQFDAIFCIGNSVPHLKGVGDLKVTFQNFSECLTNDGIVVIQLINFNRVYSRKKRIVGISRQGSREYIRFYDILPDYVRFNTLIIQWDGDKAYHKIISTRLHPFRKEELKLAFLDKGFKDLRFYGDMKFSPFDERNSTDLIVVAKK